MLVAVSLVYDRCLITQSGREYCRGCHRACIRTHNRGDVIDLFKGSHYWGIPSRQIGVTDYIYQVDLKSDERIVGKRGAEIDP